MPKKRTTITPDACECCNNCAHETMTDETGQPIAGQLRPCVNCDLPISHSRKPNGA